MARLLKQSTRVQALPMALLGVGDAVVGTLIFTRGGHWELVAQLCASSLVSHVGVGDLWLSCLLRTSLLCLGAALLHSPRWRRAYRRARPDSESESMRPRAARGRILPGCCSGWANQPEEAAVKHYQPKKRGPSRPGAEQEGTLQILVMLCALFAVTGILIKVSFLACFADEIPEGVAWRWALALHAAAFTLAEFFVMRWTIAMSAKFCEPERAVHGGVGGPEDSPATPLLAPPSAAAGTGQSEDSITPGPEGGVGAVASSSMASLMSGSVDSAADSQRATEGAGGGASRDGSDAHRTRAGANKRAGMARLCSMALYEWPYLIAAVVFLLLAAGESPWVWRACKCAGVASLMMLACKCAGVASLMMLASTPVGPGGAA